jgi:hypothetical protein
MEAKAREKFGDFLVAARARANNIMGVLSWISSSSASTAPWHNRGDPTDMNIVTWQNRGKRTEK